MKLFEENPLIKKKRQSSASSETYTVQKGDTLSKIAKKKGVSVGDIGGYKSGDPSIIYPGEELTIGGGQSSSSQEATTQTTTSDTYKAGGQVYPSKEWYEQNVNPETGKLKVTEKRESMVGNFEVGEDEHVTTSDVTDIPDDLGDTTPEDGETAVEDISSEATARINQLEEQLEESQKAQEKLDEVVQEVTGTEKTGLAGLLEGIGKGPSGPTREDKLESLQEEYGVEEISDDVKEQGTRVASLKEEIDKLDVKQQQEIDQARQRLASEGAVNAEINSINRKYESKKAYKSAQLAGEAATLQALQGDFNRAQSMVDKAVKAYTWDQEREIQRMNNFYSLYGDVYESMEDDQQDLIDTIYEEKKLQLEQTREEKQTIMQYIVDAASQGITLPVSLDDDLETVTQTYADMVSSKVQQQQAAQAGAGGLGMPTGTQTERAIAIASQTLAQAPKGEDGYINPQDYLSIRSQVAMNPDTFDQRFANQYLSSEERQNLGISTTDIEDMSKKQRTALSEIDNLESTISELLVNLPGAPKSGLAARGVGLLRGAGARIGLNKSTRVYRQQKESIATSLARILLGEVGVLTDQDVKRAERMLPSVGESAAEQQKKLKTLRNLITEQKEAVYREAGRKPPINIYETKF